MHVRKLSLAAAILLSALVPSAATAARALYAPNSTSGKLTADILDRVAR